MEHQNVLPIMNKQWSATSIGPPRRNDAVPKESRDINHKANYKTTTRKSPKYFSAPEDSAKIENKILPEGTNEKSDIVVHWTIVTRPEN